MNNWEIEIKDNYTKEFKPSKEQTMALIASMAEVKRDNKLLTAIQNDNDRILLEYKITRNALLELTLNEDYWLVPYNRVLKEVKTVDGWKKLLNKFCKDKVKKITTIVKFKDEKISTQIDETGRLKYQYQFKITGDKSYNNIDLTLCIIDFENGKQVYRYLNKEEIDVLRDSAPTKFVWNKFPRKMVETKIIKETIMRECILNFNEIIANNNYSVDKKAIINDDNAILLDKNKQVVAKYIADNEKEMKVEPTKEAIEVAKDLQGENDGNDFINCDNCDELYPVNGQCAVCYGGNE